MIEQQTPAVDVFAQALAKRQAQAKEQEEAKNNSGWTADYEDVEVVGLVANKEIVGRIIGNPLEAREKSTDAKLVLQSKIVKSDKKGYIKINWPIKEVKGKYVPDPEWILTRFYDKVNAGRWVKFSEGILKDDKGNVYPPDYLDAKGKNGKWVKENTHTKVFEEIEANSKIGEKYPPSFYPSKRIVFNWIDRHDNWCVENKHSKILSAKKAPFEAVQADGTKKTIYFTDTGIPASLYDKIFEYCSAVGTMDIDLVITKIEKDYKVFDSTDFPKFITEASHKLGVKTKLSEEEKAYELYDLDKLYKISSYRKIKKNLLSLFKLCDAELGTSFEKELEELCKIEEETTKAEKEVYYIHPESGGYGITTTEDLAEMMEHEPNVMEVSKEQYDKFVKQIEDENTAKEVKEQVKEEVKIETKRREVKTEIKEQDSSDIPYLCKENFVSWDKLTEEEKTFMLGFITRFNGTVPVYKDNTPLGCSDETCYFKDTKEMTMVPVEVNTCPVCGRMLS